MLQLRLLIAIGAVLAALLVFALGIAVGAINSVDEFNTILMPFLSMTGAWASGIGTLSAVWVAIQIATTQATESRLQGSLRCAHYSIVLVDDLLARVKYQKQMLEEGGRPLASLHENTESMARRYEGLFHHEQYLYLPGPALESLKKLSIGFFNQSVMAELLRAKLPSAMDATLPASCDSAKPLCDELTRLLRDLEELKGHLYVFRSKLPEHWHV